MPFLAARSRPLRRFLAVLLTLSVLLATLGWRHSSCVESTEPFGVTSSPTAHASPGASHIAVRDDLKVDRHASDGCCGTHQHEQGGGCECALGTHCTVTMVAMGTLLAAPQVRALDPTIVLTVSRPLEATYQPDSPPPKA